MGTINLYNLIILFIYFCIPFTCLGIVLINKFRMVKEDAALKAANSTEAKNTKVVSFLDPSKRHKGQ